MQSVLEKRGTEVLLGARGGRERRGLMDYLAIPVTKVNMEKEVPKVFLDAEARKDAQV